VHQTVRAAISTGRAVLETSAGRIREATHDVERLTIATQLAVTDRESYAPQEAADQRDVLRAITDLTKLQTAHQTIVEAAVEADTAQEVATADLQLAQESDEAARTARYPCTLLKVRTPPPLPIHGAGAATSPATVTQPTQPESPPIPPAAPAGVVAPPPAAPPPVPPPGPTNPLTCCLTRQEG
jgi:hypothetical protein